MRVIAGTAKGHSLKAPKGYKTRPTSDRIKEALFNILQGVVNGATVLDLFAGTGALGIEALSRGAQRVTFVEAWLPAYQCILSNLSATNLRDSAEVIHGDSLAFLNRCQEKYDIILIDPPYKKKLAEQALKAIALKSLLKANGLVVVETAKEEILPQTIINLKNFRQNRYGDTLLWFYCSTADKEETHGHI